MAKHRLETVLGTSDLNEASDPAVLAAVGLASAGGNAAHLFHCVPRPFFPGWKDETDRDTREGWLEDGRAELELQRRRVLGDDPPALEPVVRFGSPSVEITRYAAEISADVIVLGPHEPRRLFDDLLGTTADRVLRTAGTPTLLVHRPLAPVLSRILVATDFSAHARHALDTLVDWLAHSLARPQDAARTAPVVDLLHISAFASRRPRSLNAKAMLEDEIEAVRRHLPDPSVVDFRPQILSASLEVEGIADACERGNPDLVVLGTHGHGFLARRLLGGTASAVARTVRRPLLLVPAHRERRSS